MCPPAGAAAVPVGLRETAGLSSPDSPGLKGSGTEQRDVLIQALRELQDGFFDLPPGSANKAGGPAITVGPDQEIGPSLSLSSPLEPQAASVDDAP
jgi:hypothetical protein